MPATPKDGQCWWFAGGVMKTSSPPCREFRHGDRPVRTLERLKFVPVLDLTTMNSE